MFNSQFDQVQRNKKNAAIQQYKDSLDNQIKNRQALKAYGNMTNVEKELNKDDLVAWKKYDNNQYSMIPGVSA